MEGILPAVLLLEEHFDPRHIPGQLDPDLIFLDCWIPRVAVPDEPGHVFMDMASSPLARLTARSDCATSAPLSLTPGNHVRWTDFLGFGLGSFGLANISLTFSLATALTVLLHC